MGAGVGGCVSANPPRYVFYLISFISSAIKILKLLLTTMVDYIEIFLFVLVRISYYLTIILYAYINSLEMLFMVTSYTYHLPFTNNYLGMHSNTVQHY